MEGETGDIEEADMEGPTGDRKTNMEGQTGDIYKTDMEDRLMT